MAQSRKTTPAPPLNGWNEYKRLVLNELERLNTLAEKLRDSETENQKAISESLSEIEKTLEEQFDNTTRGLEQRIDELETSIKTYKEKEAEDKKVSHSWGFWAAVVSIVGSLIVSTISLIAALNS